MMSTTAALPQQSSTPLRSSPPATAQLPRQASPLMRSLCVVAAAGASD